MAEHDDEREASRLYASLPREEPPAGLDARIRAQARSALETHPAPLVPPTGRSGWYFPLAAAAVIVLAVAVTWQIQREQPDDGDAQIPRAASESPSAAASGRLAEPKVEAPRAAQAPAPAPERRVLPRERMSRDEVMRQENRADGQGYAQNRAAPLAKQLSAEAELERIAELRRQGKDDEADRALAAFRKRFPDYRISAEMLRRVERKK